MELCGVLHCSNPEELLKSGYPLVSRLFLLQNGDAIETLGNFSEHKEASEGFWFQG